MSRRRSRSDLWVIFQSCLRRAKFEHAKLLGDRLGVTSLGAVIDAGFFGVNRIITHPGERLFDIHEDGEPAFVFPICKERVDYIAESIYDLWALPLSNPDLPYRMTAAAAFMGEHRMLSVLDRDQPLKVYRTPLDLLRGGYDGVAPFSLDEAARALLGFYKLEVPDKAFAHELATALQLEALKNLPVIDYPLLQAAE